MGIKVEGETYIPGYIDMQNSSINSNGNMSPYQKENKPSVYLTEKFTIIASNGSVHYDKEMIKRTMLVHEATFRKQVYELHRLYKIQNELMARFQREELNGFRRYADELQPRSSTSQALLSDVKGMRQTANPISGHDPKQSCINLINESTSQYSVSGTPLRNNNVRSQKKMFDLQLPADVYTDDDDDDDVEILEVRPSKSLPGANGSVLFGNVNLSLQNSEGSAHMNSWSTDMHAHHSSAVHILNKLVQESSSMNTTDFLGLGISAPQNQHYVSQGVNMNHISLEAKLKEKSAGKASDSRFFGANEETRNSNLFQQRKDGSNTSMAWYKQNCTVSSMGHYAPRASTFNHSILAPVGFNDALNPPWQSNNTSYLPKSHCGAAETFIAKDALSNGISMDSTPKAPYHHSLKIHGGAGYQKLPALHDNHKGIDLNATPVDTAAIWEQGSEKSVADISWLCKKPVSLTESQVPSTYAKDHSQNLPSPTLYSESRTPTRVPAFPISVSTEKDPQRSPTLQYDLNNGPSIKCEADMEIQPQCKEGDTDIRYLIDLNEALPTIDDAHESGEMDAHESVEIVPREPNDASQDSMAIEAAEKLLQMWNDIVQPADPQPDVLHWFADLAISNHNTVLDKDSDDDFEAATLKLRETKSTECHSTPRTTQEDNRNCSNRSAASLVLKPQRGRGRGQRQRKDFQRDILPGLASLPKHEVSEDLHALGRSKPVTPTKRGRKRQQPRGRRRARSVAVAMEVEETKVSPPPQASPSLVPADLDADALGITSWGRTTRRCRRPRCPPVNNASLRVA